MILTDLLAGQTELLAELRQAEGVKRGAAQSGSRGVQRGGRAAAVRPSAPRARPAPRPAPAPSTVPGPAATGQWYADDRPADERPGGRPPRA